jgi:serine/threonine protein kinase
LAATGGVAERPGLAIRQHLGIQPNAPFGGAAAASGARPQSSEQSSAKNSESVPGGIMGLRCRKFSLNAIGDGEGDMLATSNNSVVELGRIGETLMIRKSHVKTGVSREAFAQEWSIYLTLATLPRELSGVLPLCGVDYANRIFYFEYAKRRSVYDYCRENEATLTMLQRLELCRAIALAVQRLHATSPKYPLKKPIVHFDIKPCKSPSLPSLPTCRCAYHDRCD